MMLHERQSYTWISNCRKRVSNKIAYLWLKAEPICVKETATEKKGVEIANATAKI
jgi:hypothetical protein